MPTTPNMDLLLPDPTITPGPTYASENNDAFDLVDSHDHTFGKGVPIPSNAININNDLAYNGYNLTSIRATRFNSQSAFLSLPADINQLYVVNGNLVYNNNLGQPVQITSGAALDATSIGGIGGDYATSTALVFYTSADKTFTFWSNTNTPASIDGGPITIRNDTLNSDGITLSAPNALATNYQLTFPLTLPTSESAISVDPSGNLSFSAGGSIPVGGMVMYGGASAPSGYLICDGSAINRVTFSALFTAISTNYGVGDGTTTFNIPDLRGLFPRGVDNGAGNDPDTLTRTATNGGNSGDNVGSFQLDEFASHTHGIFNYITTQNPVTNFPNAGASGAFNPPTAAGGNETRPKNVYVNFIIKV